MAFFKIEVQLTYMKYMKITYEYMKIAFTYMKITCYVKIAY